MNELNRGCSSKTRRVILITYSSIKTFLWNFRKSYSRDDKNIDLFLCLIESLDIIITHLLQLLLLGDDPSSSMLFALKKFSWKNFKKCGRFLIKLLFTSFSLSLIWLSNSMLVVAFDFDLYAVGGEFVRRHPVCEPNNPIMSNSYRMCMQF